MIRTLLLALTLTAVASPAAAHPLAPSSLRLVEATDGHVEATWRTPARRPIGQDLTPRWPDRCVPAGPPRVAPTRSFVELHQTLACEHGLIGAQVRIDGLEHAETTVLLSVTHATGARTQHLLHADAASVVLPGAPSPLDVAARYLGLGITHLLGGLDHLLFLLGLLLLVRGRRRLVAAVTAFTLGHSLTLALATLGWAALPPALAEAAIAASLVVLGLEVLGGHRWLSSRPGWGSGAFGLVHGLGFAGALAEVGLPPADVPLALGAFNVGIELGQLAVVSAALLAAGLVPAAPRLRAPAAWVIGVLGASWLVERSLLLLA